MMAHPHRGRARAPSLRTARTSGRGRVRRAVTARSKQAVKSHVRRWVIVGGAVVVAAAVLLTLMIAAVTGIPAADDLEVLAELEGFLTAEQVERLDELLVGIERPRDIPLLPFALYVLAADEHGLDWTILAGIGEVECDHGRSQLEGCNPPGTVNPAGARGPMQFLGSTWRASEDRFEADVSGAPIPDGAESQGYATDGDGDGTADPWVANDAIHAAARYLRHNGAPGDYDAAVWAYNHSDPYRAEVMRWADTYRAEAEAAAATGEQAVAGDVPLSTVRGITVHSSIAADLDAMLAAAQTDGLALTGSGYRPTSRQIELRQINGCPDIYESPASDCVVPTARPGTSLHEQGLAIDFTNCSTQTTACYQWLDEHAAAYGLYNFEEEPWHWSIDGT